LTAILASTRSGIEHQRNASAFNSEVSAKYVPKVFFSGRAKFEPNAWNIKTFGRNLSVGQGLYWSRTKVLGTEMPVQRQPLARLQDFVNELTALSLMEKRCAKVVGRISKMDRP